MGFQASAAAVRGGTDGGPACPRRPGVSLRMFAGQYWIGSGSPRRTTGGDFGLVRSQRGSSRSLGLDSWRTRRRAGCVRGQHWRRTNLPAGPPPVLRAGGGGPQSVSCCCLQLRGGEARSAGRREACRIPFWAQFHSLLG